MLKVAIPRARRPTGRPTIIFSAREVVGMIRDIPSVKEVIGGIVKEAGEILERLCSVKV